MKSWPNALCSHSYSHPKINSADICSRSVTHRYTFTLLKTGQTLEDTPSRSTVSLLEQLTAARSESRTTESSRGETAPSLLPPSHIYRHEKCSTCRVVGPFACLDYSLSACMGDVHRHRVSTVHDHSEGLAVVGLLKGGLPADQHEQDHPKTPDICTDTERRLWSERRRVTTNTTMCVVTA